MEFIVAHCLYKLKNYEDARIHYLQFLKNKRSDAGDVINCYQNLALLCYDLSDYAQCILYFAYLDDERINDKNLEFYLAHSLHENGDFDECIKFYKAFLHKFPNHFDACHNLANVYFSKKQYKEAIDAYTHLSEDELIKRKLCKKMSECYVHINDDENAQKYMKLAVDSKKSKNVMQRIKVAQSYYNLEQNEAAIKVFEEIGDDEIVSNNLEFVCAHCYQLMADNKAAIKYYKMGLTNDRNLENEDAVKSAYHNLGCAYHDAEDYTNAIECFSKMSTEHIIGTNVEFIIAASYHQLKRDKEALVYYEMYLDNALSKGSENVMSTYHNMVLIYYYSLNDYEQAWNVMERMGDDMIKEKNLEFEKAHCAQQMNDRAGAIKYYSMLLRDGKDTKDEKVIGDVYRNVCALNVNDETFNHQIKQFKKTGNKQKELQLFVEWITSEHVK